MKVQRVSSVWRSLFDVIGLKLNGLVFWMDSKDMIELKYIFHETPYCYTKPVTIHDELFAIYQRFDLQKSYVPLFTAVSCSVFCLNLTVQLNKLNKNSLKNISSKNIIFS